MREASRYPIGTPGQPWGDAEKSQWLARQCKQRSHADDVVAVVETLGDRLDVECYGHIDVSAQRYPLLALRTRGWHSSRPTLLVTGGVHGYETSGVLGALDFARQCMADYTGKANILLVPCVSPWAWEHVQRWNAQALDPNRNFRADSPCGESAALWRLLEPLRQTIAMHIDLHETTDSDEGEFRPALAARDGQPFEAGEIPDGFYLVDDEDQPQPEFQAVVIAAVAKITHIAPADAHGQIIGSEVVAPGVIRYRLREWGLCAGITDARFRTTTEVYPDSPRTNPPQCIAAQVAAVEAAIGFALAAR